jgi:hypothetical protein
MCVYILCPLGVTRQLYASAVAGGGPWLPERAPARTVYGRIAIRPYPMPALGSPRGPLAWRPCRLLPHPAGAPVYSKTLDLSGLNPADVASDRNLYR